jgi:hypothetical protein
MAWSHAALNIALDFCILVLPATQVYDMNIPPQKKAQILLVFGFGILYGFCFFPSFSLFLGQTNLLKEGGTPADS